MPSDRHVTRTGDDYWLALSKYLPTGLAWPRDFGSTLMITLRGLAQVWGFVEQRASQLLEVDSDPRYTVELLPDWERNFGLPDPCYTAPLSIGERHLALLQRMTLEGSQSRQFYIDFAAQLGYTITISEYRPFMIALDRCGDNRVYGDGTNPMFSPMFVSGYLPVYNPNGERVRQGELSEYPNYGLGPDTNRFYWQVHVHEAKLVWFRCGSGQCGIDPHLRIGHALDLECVLDRWKPAHTDIIYDYSNLTTASQLYPISATLSGAASLAAAVTGRDPYFANVVLLMGFEGTNGSSGAPGMTDESPWVHGTATANSSTIGTAQFKFGSSSLNRSSGAGNITFPDSSDFNFANGRFTVECWVRFSSTSGQQFFVGQWQNAGNLGWVLNTGPSGTTLSWNWSTDGTNNNAIDTTWSPTTGVWYHIAVDFDGTKTRCYVNGVMTGSSTAAPAIFDSPNVLSIGSNASNNAFWFTGWMDELRISKGVSRYASDSGFTVPTTAFPRS